MTDCNSGDHDTVLILNADEVRRALPMPQAIDAMKQAFAANEIMTLSISKLPAGSYAVKVMNDKEQGVQQLIVNK